ncbi:MAG: hypothetical protein V3V55_07140, partial [Rhodospirillales bacterium]
MRQAKTAPAPKRRGLVELSAWIVKSSFADCCWHRADNRYACLEQIQIEWRLMTRMRETYNAMKHHIREVDDTVIVAFEG